MALEDEKLIPGVKNWTLQEQVQHLLAIESTLQQPHDSRFWVLVPLLQPLMTPEPSSSSTSLPTFQSIITSGFISTPVSAMLDLTVSQADSIGFLALHRTKSPFIQSTLLHHSNR